MVRFQELLPLDLLVLPLHNPLEHHPLTGKHKYRHPSEAHHHHQLHRLKPSVKKAKSCNLIKSTQSNLFSQSPLTQSASPARPTTHRKNCFVGACQAIKLLHSSPLCFCSTFLCPFFVSHLCFNSFIQYYPSLLTCSICLIIHGDIGRRSSTTSRLCPAAANF